jgi:hypothetical protein
MGSIIGSAGVKTDRRGMVDPKGKGPENILREKAKEIKRTGFFGNGKRGQSE